MEHEAILALVGKTTPPDADEVREAKELIGRFVGRHRPSKEVSNGISTIYNAYLNVRMAQIVDDGSMVADAMKELQSALKSIAKTECR